MREKERKIERKRNRGNKFVRIEGKMQKKRERGER